jgi:isoleucyl-tRNA synthetase
MNLTHIAQLHAVNADSRATTGMIGRIVGNGTVGCLGQPQTGENRFQLTLKSKEGFVAESNNGITVVLDTNITEELKLEGVKREIISKIQTMRKDAGFEVTDRITVNFVAEGNALKVLTENGDEIASVVLADSIVEGKTTGFEKELDVNKEKCVIIINKV